MFTYHVRKMARKVGDQEISLWQRETILRGLNITQTSEETFAVYFDFPWRLSCVYWEYKTI